jgi:hypothetical protein
MGSNARSKVLSSEMDSAENRLIFRNYLKREARRFLEKSARLPSCESSLKPKDSTPSYTAIGNKNPNCQRRAQLCQRPFIYYIQLLATPSEQSWDLFQMAQLKF